MTAKTVPVLLLSALLGALAGVLAVLLLAPRPTAVPLAGEELAALERAVAQLAERTDRLALQVEEQAALPRSAGAARVPLEEIDAAVARYLSGRGGEGGEAEIAEPTGDAAASSGRAAPRRAVEDAFAQLLSGELSQEERQALWARMAAEGLSDELVALFEERVEREPNDPQLRVELGEAYLQKVFEVGGSSPTAGLWAMKADGAFDAALALDEQHWDARFSKAISYSFWPPALGMQNKAIAQFEILLEQQQGQAKSPQFAQTYYFLGNMYQQTGNPSKALAIWQEGAALYPDDAQLAAQLAAAQGQ
jgi:tetratricopeptide (TPR) repeat protein